MPTYDYKNTKTGKITEHSMKISEIDQFKKDHPELTQVILSAAHFNYSGDHSDPTTSATKKHKGWKEVLQKIGEANPHSRVAADHGANKSLNRHKAEQIVEKHVKIQQEQKKKWADILAKGK